MPAVISLSIVLLDTFGSCSLTLPNMAWHDCFPSSGLYGQSDLTFQDTSQFLYFFLIVMIILIVNVICFVLTGFFLTRHRFMNASLDTRQQIFSIELFIIRD